MELALVFLLAVVFLLVYIYASRRGKELRRRRKAVLLRSKKHLSELQAEKDNNKEDGTEMRE